MYYAVLKDSLDSGEGDGMSDGDKKRLRRAYRDAVRSIDKFVGKILEDCSDDTIVVFHSDHGEAFGEHGTWGHKSQLYRENLHVPFLVSGMGSESVRDPVSLRKIPEIIMEIANKPQNFNPDEYTNRFVYSTTERGDKTSLSGTDWKFIIDSDTAELYSLTDDPHEQTNISNNSGNIVRLFEQLARTRQTRANEKTAIAKATDAVRKI
jgi:arylsulfatase